MAKIRLVPLNKLLAESEEPSSTNNGGSASLSTSKKQRNSIVELGSSDDSESESRSKNNKKEATNGDLDDSCVSDSPSSSAKNVKIVLSKMKPEKLIKMHNLKEIRGIDNKVIAKKNAITTNGTSKNNESSDESDDEKLNSDSDSPLVQSTRGRRSPIPSTSKNGTATDSQEIIRPRASKRQKKKVVVSDSGSNFGSDSSNESSSNSSEIKSEEDLPKRRRKRGPPRKRKRNSSNSDSDLKLFEDSEDEELREKMKEKRKRKRIKEIPSSDDDENAKKKKKTDDKKSDDKGSDDDDKLNTTGRKNIRSFKSTQKLEETTKQAARDEKMRLQRLEERQKLYNQLYEDKNKSEESPICDKLILDFDEESKEVTLEVDKGIVSCLKPHQCNGVKFMWEACFESLDRIEKGPGSGCILAHCMGLGKTLQVVSLVHTLLANSEKTKVERILVVCPLSTVLNWVNEFDIWCAKAESEYEVNLYEMSRAKNNVERAYRLKEWYEDGGVMIIGYDMFRNISNPKTKIRKKLREDIAKALLDPGPDLVICDEGHLLKNEKTAISKAMNQIRSLRRVVLTGTPLQNNLKEYYCMVQFVKPNLLGKYTEYMNRFVNPITNGQYVDSTDLDIKIMKRRSHVLHNMLEGCVQRRDYSVLAPFLPIKHEYVISIRLTELQIKLYKYYMEHKPSVETSRKAATLFQDFQNLQRIWTHPRVLRYNSDRFEREQAKRELEYDEEDSEGSLKDFIEDSDEDSANSTSSGSGSEAEAAPKPKKIIRTRAMVAEAPEEAEPLVQLEDEKRENPTEWWTTMVTDEDLDNIEHSSKLTILFSILQQCESIGDKLLVFTQSLYSLDVIEHFLRIIDEQTQSQEYENPKYSGSWSLGLDYFRLDGSTNVENRNNFCNIFNDETNTRARLFLISTRAGGLGINLVAANRVIIFDVSWNPSHDIQSIFRIYRFGQKKPCYVYRFVALGTMEEKIYERQVTKEAISKRVIDEQQIDRHYREVDIMALYSGDLEPEKSTETPRLPKDRLFADILSEYPDLVHRYHEHDSLLENKEGETLDEEERKAAWDDYNSEKDRINQIQTYTGYTYQGTQGGRAMTGGPVTSNNIFGFRSDVLLNLLRIKCRTTFPHMPETQINNMVPQLVQELHAQMKQGEITLYQELVDLQNLMIATGMTGNNLANMPGMNPIFNRAHGQQPMSFGYKGLQPMAHQSVSSKFIPNETIEIDDDDE